MSLRRFFDLCASLGGLVVLAPLFLVIAILIRLETKGPIIFKGSRAGKDGKPFKIWKFRTMVSGADKMGPGITVSGDARVTKMGRFLRKTKLDEFPQLVNVLLGDMTFVGPRPEDPRYIAKRPDLYAEVLKFKPGITGAGSLLLRNEESLLAGDNFEEAYFEVVLPQKLAADLAYAEKQTFWSDLKLIFSTVKRLKGN